MYLLTNSRNGTGREGSWHLCEGGDMFLSDAVGSPGKAVIFNSNAFPVGDEHPLLPQHQMLCSLLAKMHVKYDEPATLK